MAINLTNLYGQFPTVFLGSTLMNTVAATSTPIPCGKMPN